MKRILILANNDTGLYNFRKELLQELIEKNYEVYISLPNGRRVSDLVNMGCLFINTPVDRRGMNLINDLKLFVSYIRIYKKIKPEIVLTYTIKPNIYGGIASRFFNFDLFPYVAGLGTPFQKKNLIKKLLIVLHRLAFKNAKNIFFENVESMKFYQENNLVFGNIIKIPGAGVNLEEYSCENYPISSENIRFLYIGRVMKEKGIDELFEAATKIKKQFDNVIFDIVGPLEEDYKDKILELQKKGVIRYHGFQLDIRPHVKQSHCIVLPSYHEGMANVLLEAASMGRPLITSNIHGCLEAVENYKNGYLCKVKNSQDLYEKLLKFIELEYHQKVEMGKRSRKLMENVFDRKKVVNTMINQFD